MEEVLQNVVDLLKGHPAGIPLKKLTMFYNQTYRSNLSFRALHFESLAQLVDSRRELSVVGQLVFHEDHLPRSQSAAGAEGGAASTGGDSKSRVLENLVLMMREHPAGVPLPKVATLYSQTYHHNLALASLGFKTISSLVATLEKDLHVEGDIVFHKIYLAQNQPQAWKARQAKEGSRPATPQTPDSLSRGCSPGPLRDTSSPLWAPPSQAGVSLLGSPLISFGSSSSIKHVSESPVLTQDQLLQRIMEVLRKYQLTAPSMDQLQACYYGLFGEQFPVAQYMSLYDNLEAEKKPDKSQPKATPKTSAWGAAEAAKNPKREPKRELPLPSGPGHLSESDFPALGAGGDASLTKEQRSRTKDSGQKEASAPSFRGAYHAQLREVHGGNMRALEAIEDDEEEQTGRRRRRNGAVDQEEINSLMCSVIREIADEGELVTKEKVISRVCMMVPSLDPRTLKPWTFSALKDLQYLIREINMFIECTEAATSICTLYELGQTLAGLKDKKHYEELNLGPLCKLPLIHRMFKIDSNTKDDDIPQIETKDILKQIRVFRRKQTKQKLDLAEFLQYLADHYSCESPYELGIRIHSFGLPIGTIMKVSRIEHTILERAREVIQRELEEETLERLRKIKKNVLEQLQGAGSFSSTGNLDLRKKYASMPAGEVVLEVLSNAVGVFSPRMTKHVESFLAQVSNDRLAKALFQLAVCGGSLAAPQDLVLKDKTSKPSEQTKTADKAPTVIPSEAKVKQALKDSLATINSAITLGHIAAVEKKVTKQFQAKDFLSLEQGTFLEFLVKHIQLLQDALGSVLFLGSNVERPGNSSRPSRQDVFEFIKQCGSVASTEPDDISHIEAALRSHYRLRDSRDLGYGTLQMLVGLVQRQRELAGGGLSPVCYESALLAKHSKSSPQSGNESVGCLGDMSKAQALASLLSCPLLEDLHDWSQWELIFKPLHGPLRDFIETNAAKMDLAALEVAPGMLLRITTATGDKHFSRASAALDPVGTAGHLVSIVVADGVDNAPTALLANHMQSSLAAAVASEDLSRAEEDVACYSRVAKFLLACLIRIPTRTCQALLQQVFLEPFSRVLGQAKSKQVLVAVAQSDPRHLNCLHRLGILLGVTDWVKDYQKKLNQDGHPHAAPMVKAKSNLIDSESSSLSALNTSEDEYLDDDIMDSSSVSSQLNHSQQQVNGDLDVEIEDEEDGEELYELASLQNGETSDINGEAEGAQSDEPLENADPDEKRDAGSQSEAALHHQKAIIEEIRKNEFGVGVELNEEGQKLMLTHQERLGRSLDRLSTELYSKDTHFVLELIQNADDNSYPSEAGVVPALAFVVERDCISVLNNETGFQEKNIKAICDVGRSTKGKHKYGYIGQKGIGFKSVFKVTDCPEIHSNGFHLRFDKSCGPMGYILPHWTEDERPLDVQLKDMKRHSWTTKICLPLRSESHQTRNLFHDVHSSLLLFLHRLRSITIYNQMEKRLVSMTRKDLSHNVLEVEHTEGVERWLVVKTRLEPKKIKEDVESTELALAFQLAEGEVSCQPQKQPVFAYLPLRSFGFRFIIQGDFDIPSSREDVDRDSSWNQWLRSEIPQLFLQAMNNFTDHPEFKGLKGLCQFLQFVPLPDEVLDFFKPVAGQIIQLLKGKAFLPTLSSAGEVVYKLPSQVAVCQDAVIRSVIGGDELEKHLSLSYLHPGLSPAPPNSLLNHLGVRNLRGSDVTTVTNAMARELVKEQSLNSEGALRQLARLLVCNFRAMEHGFEEADSVLQNLRDLPIIPLADGSVVALSGEGLFFPLEETRTKKKDTKTGPLSALYKDVNVVHPSLLNCLEPLENQQVRELLKRLGVHELEPQELLEEHIYPTIKNNKWKSKAESVVVSYLVFIKQHSSSSQEYSDMAVPVLTCRGLSCPVTERVHFSEEYSNINLTKKLPGYDWVLLSPCYVQTDGDVAGWRELFIQLGVRDGLIIRKERRTLSSEELSGAWRQPPGEKCVLDDYPCEELQALAAAQLPGSVLLQQRTALLELLESNWDSGHCYSQYLTAQVVDSDGRPIKPTKSSFYHMLCHLEWVPAYRPLEEEGQERKYLSPSSVYLRSPEVTKLLGTHVFYVDIQPSEFSRALGMRESVSVEVLIDYLKKWCVQPAADHQDEAEGATFTTTVQHIHSVYTFLREKCSQHSLKELFQHTPAVRNEKWCSGRFYHLKDVCWSDTTTMFQRYRQLTHRPDSPVQDPKVLAPFYHQLEDMRDFFLRQLNVDPSPTMKQYVGLLELICSSSDMPTAEVLQDVSVVYARLAQKCKNQPSGDQENTPQFHPGYCSTLKGMVSDKWVFPTKDNRWVSLARKPMISDDKELEKVFKHHKQVCLLNLPAAEKKAAPRNKTGHSVAGDRATMAAFNEWDRLTFLEICGVRKLSECVIYEAQTENLRPCPSMQAMVRSVVPYIQRFLYHHDELGEVYSELTHRNIAQKIKHLHFGQVGKLYIRYQLDVADDEDPLIELQDVICLLKDEKEFYIQKDHLTAKLDICRELVKLFCTESSHRKDLMQFVSSLITCLHDPKALSRFLNKEDIRELPSEEEQWEVPEPPRPEMNMDRVPMRSFSSMSSSEEQAPPTPADGEQTLVCWPPRASILSTGSSRAGQADSSAVEAVMKMWPPPAGPKDLDPDREVSPRAGGHDGEQPPRSSTRPPDPQRMGGTWRSHRAVSPFNAPRETEQTPLPAGVLHTERAQNSPAERGQQSQTAQSEGGAEPPTAPGRSPPPPQPAEAPSDPPPPSTPAVPEAVLVSGTFQGAPPGAEAQRPPLNLDFPLWSREQPSQATLEDVELTCQRPTTVVLSDDPMDVAAIGEWGEQLVHSFLCHWRDGSDPGRPTRVLWCNQSGESGQPYDFQLTGPAGVVFVEVKSTIKKERSFIHLSANELDFALKERERYHVFRVYSAGDAHNVRLCRIQNLAQLLHTKELALYLFV
ncbi:unnamed protein product [Menidia menidia]|uniref:(Atlantic silverside) hypothetical protein n=1 Tax=Menidia menidia TaxID=238744 RepID=A0A8S4AW80_9TELE|nr:unnamed protein product [Menidia menidia]